MKQVRRRDTPRELALRALLHRRGLRYRVDAAPVSGFRRRADLVFATARVAVFVDGCFWHACPIHGEVPRRNREWWESKLARNQARDFNTDVMLAREGWISLRIWEHQSPERVASSIERLVRYRQSREQR